MGEFHELPSAGLHLRLVAMGKGLLLNTEHFAFTLTSAGGPGSDLSIPLISEGYLGLSGRLGLFQDPAVMSLYM